VGVDCRLPVAAAREVMFLEIPPLKNNQLNMDFLVIDDDKPFRAPPVC